MTSEEHVRLRSRVARLLFDRFPPKEPLEVRAPWMVSPWIEVADVVIKEVLAQVLPLEAEAT